MGHPLISKLTSAIRNRLLEFTDSSPRRDSTGFGTGSHLIRLSRTNSSAYYSSS